LRSSLSLREGIQQEKEFYSSFLTVTSEISFFFFSLLKTKKLEMKSPKKKKRRGKKIFLFIFFSIYRQVNQKRQLWPEA